MREALLARAHCAVCQPAENVSRMLGFPHPGLRSRKLCPRGAASPKPSLVVAVFMQWAPPKLARELPGSPPPRSLLYTSVSQGKKIQWLGEGGVGGCLGRAWESHLV